MRKIGFIDHFIDEWHANNYPRMIRESSLGGQFEVAMAWEETTAPGKRPLDVWCRQMGIRQADSLEQVVRECDCIVVLSPDNAERHEALADLPLRSGKPVYIDKPIAPSLAAAQRLFAKARSHNTPMMSCSALRYGSALQQLREDTAGEPVHLVATRGGGMFSNYAIHQIEMLVATLGLGARRIMQCGNAHSTVLLVDYADGRRGVMHQSPQQRFQLTAAYGDNKGMVIEKMDDFFPRFVEATLRFFVTATPITPEAETIEVAALLEAGARALASPDVWVDVPAR